MYITKFDEAGKPSGFLRPGINISVDDVAAKIAEGYVDISDEEWSYYVGNKGNGDNGTGYVRGADGKPVSAPAYVPTKEEQANSLASTYATAIKTANDGIILASAEGDTEAIEEYKADKAAALAEYKAKLEVIK